eukprot:gene9995-7879_t
MEVCRRELLELVNDRLHRKFSQFPNMILAVSAAMASLLDAKAEICRKRLSEVMQMEAHVYTRNNRYFCKSETDFMASLKKAYLGSFNEPEDADALLANIQRMGIKCNSLETLYLTQGTAVDDELHIMSATLAYFNVAVDRTLDVIPQHINEFLLRSYKDPLQMHRAVLEIVTNDLKSAGWEMKDVFAEDADTIKRRIKLQDQKDRLKKAVGLLVRPMHPTRR